MNPRGEEPSIFRLRVLEKLFNESAIKEAENDDEKPAKPLKIFATTVVSNKWFERFILVIIIANAIITGCQTSNFLERNIGLLMDVLDVCFLAIFVIEILMKWTSDWKNYWPDNWNRFDFIIVAASLIAFIVEVLIGGGDQNISKILSVIRSLRVLRILKLMSGLQVVVNTFLQSLLDIANIAILTLIIVFIFAVVGVQLFKEKLPEFYGDLWLSMYTLWIFLTQDGWFTIFKTYEEKSEAFPFGFALYIVLFIGLAAWVFMNVVSGVTTVNWQIFVSEMKIAERKREALMNPGDFDSDQVVPTRTIEKVNPMLWNLQKPREIVKVENMTVNKFQNYLLMLAALEQNVLEFNKLYDELRSHYDEIQQCNGNGRPISPSKEEPRIIRGDVMSSLINFNVARKRHKDTALGKMISDGLAYQQAYGTAARRNSGVNKPNGPLGTILREFKSQSTHNG